MRIPINTTFSLNSSFFKVTIPIIVFWILMFLWGFPPPYQDDIFFTGAAINYAQNGQFQNPYILSPFSAHNFYLYTPYHGLILASWIKFFGINKSSLLLFQCSCCAIVSISIASIMRRFSLPSFTIYFGVLITAFFFRTMGLRPDPLGIAVLLLGEVFLIQNILITDFLGFFLIVSSVLIQPATLAYALSISGGVCWINYRINSLSKQRIYAVLITLAIAIITSLFLFLVCIEFDIHSFIVQFEFNRSVAAKGTILEKILEFISLFFDDYGLILFIPSLLMSIVMIYFLIKNRRQYNFEQRILLLSLLAGIFLSIGLHARRDFILFFIWLFIISTFSILFYSINFRIKNHNKLIVSSLLIASLGLTQLYEFVGLVAQEQTPQSIYSEARKFVKSHPNYQYIIDPVAARLVFNYQLPQHSISWIYHISKSIDFKDKPIYFIGSPYFIQYMGLETLKSPNLTTASKDYPRIFFLGRQFGSLPSQPLGISIIKV